MSQSPQQNRPSAPPPDVAQTHPRGSAARGLLLAIQFLTVLPVPTKLLRASGAAEGDAPVMAAALPWFPVVGAAIGVFAVLLDTALRPFFSLGVRDVLLLALPALLTGMLHLDGFVDCCDGLLGFRSVERRLEIMRDSRVGAYGAIGVVLLLLARYAALGSLAGTLRIVAFVAAPMLGRYAMVYAVTRYPYARAAGAGARFRGKTSHLLIAGGATALLLLGLALIVSAPHASSFVLHVVTLALLALVAALVAWGWAHWASSRLGGGLTGDTYGALNELVELAALLLAPALAALATHL